MTEYNYVYHDGGNVPIKTWTKGVYLEHDALEQLRNISKLPFIHKHVAAMPDVHLGIGATIGSVIATNSAIVPAAVGVDIGCGMLAYQTTLTAVDLPDSLSNLRGRIEAAVPTGKNSFSRLSNSNSNRWSALYQRYHDICEKHPKARSKANAEQLGTLGGGNHFIELCLDETGYVWVMLHSGSRGVGNRIGSYFIDKAKEEMHRYHIADHLPDKNLAYLVEHTEIFDDYVDAVHFAQDFAMENRKAMLQAVLEVLHNAPELPPFQITKNAINCHHNYVEKENHFGENVWVTRKGAVRARVGDYGIIPGSMGTRSYIVRGKGNPDSFCSCSHGAGRVMSRGKAKEMISLEDHRKAMEGIEARLDSAVLDESPAAYKDIDQVMQAQTDLVEVVHTLRQVLNIKG